jgi:hypothetical protein
MAVYNIMICDSESGSVCLVAFIFGLISIVYLVGSVVFIYKYYKKDEVKVLLFFSLTCLSMIFHYFFIGKGYDVLYFLKDYMKLITFSHICYFFIKQLYYLIEGHIFISYFGLGMIIGTITYLTGIGLYFSLDFFLISESIFECSNYFWILLRIPGVLLGILLLSVGIMISKNIKAESVLHKAEVKKKEKDLW